MSNVCSWYVTKSYRQIIISIPHYVHTQTWIMYYFKCARMIILIKVLSCLQRRHTYTSAVLLFLLLAAMLFIQMKSYFQILTFSQRFSYNENNSQVMAAYSIWRCSLSNSRKNEWLIDSFNQSENYLSLFSDTMLKKRDLRNSSAKIE